MPNVQNSQGAGAKAPPIPNMDVTPAPPATGRDIARQVRDVARQAQAAARDARRAAQDAANNQQAPTPPAGTIQRPSSNEDIIPQQAVDISLAFFFTVAFIVVGLPLARALARRLDRKTEFQRTAVPDLAPQIHQLQESVDAMAIELERISEGQRFTAKLLADRSAAQQ